MNIGFVVHDYDVREGHGRYSVELVNRISNNHDVTLYVLNLHNEPPSNVQVVRVPAVRRPSYATILSFPRAFAKVRREHDLVHTQGWNTANADIATAHICLAAWRSASRHAPASAGLAEKFLGKYIESREGVFYRSAVRHIIAPSRHVEEDLRRHYGTAKDITVIPHSFPDFEPIPSRATARAELKLPEKPFMALYAGDARKGLDVALRAIARVSDIHLVVVSRSHIRTYKNLAADLGVEDRTHWIPGMPTLQPAYAAADVLLHPTVYDAFGLVVAEAMRYGLPVIVSNEAGVSELLEDGRSAWIVRPRDPEDSAQALTALAENAELRRKFAAESQRAADQRSWDDVAAETVAIYEKVLATG